jgi:hypothetical protein
LETNKAIALTNQGIESLKADRLDGAFNFLVEAISTDLLYRNSYLQLYTLVMNDSTRIDTAISILQQSKKYFNKMMKYASIWTKCIK